MAGQGRKGLQQSKRGEQLAGHLDIEHLTISIVAAGRAGNVGGDGCAAGGAGLKQRSAPALGALPLFLHHFGFSALGTGHGSVAFEILKLVESLPNAGVRFLRRLLTDHGGRCGLEAAFGGTFPRLDVAVFAAGVVWKGQEDIFTNGLRQVHR
jgi:hypothetical protein